jgi:hypothetical protein
MHHLARLPEEANVEDPELESKVVPNFQNWWPMNTMLVSLSYLIEDVPQAYLSGKPLIK